MQYQTEIQKDNIEENTKKINSLQKMFADFMQKIGILAKEQKDLFQDEKRKKEIERIKELENSFKNNSNA